MNIKKHLKQKYADQYNKRCLKKYNIDNGGKISEDTSLIIPNVF